DEVAAGVEDLHADLPDVRAVVFARLHLIVVGDVGHRVARRDVELVGNAAAIDLREQQRRVTAELLLRRADTRSIVGGAAADRTDDDDETDEGTELHGVPPSRGDVRRAAWKERNATRTTVHRTGSNSDENVRTCSRSARRSHE